MGTRLGRYDVLRTLFKGELADLLLARRDGMEGFQRHVAIKRLHAVHARDQACLDAFVNEARLAAALHHHNVVQVLDIGEDEGQPFFAMEYVHGVDLRALLNKLSKRNEQLPMQHVVSIIAAAAAALHHAHEQKGADGNPLGIVHRDVTPGNILVGFDGNVKVVDFGIAKAAIKRISTDQGVLKGRVPYMAPEQCAGKPVDRRSDVFALGIVAFELATVRRLFKGASEFLTMSAIVNTVIPKPSQFRTDIPPELEAIMLKALARNPAERFPTAGAMALALDEVAVKVGVGASTTQLASYMRVQFGNVKEPWLDLDSFDSDAETTDVDFDGDAAGLAPPAQESVRDNAIPKGIAATRSSPIAQVRNATPPKAIDALPAAEKAAPPIEKSYSITTDVEAVSYDAMIDLGDESGDGDEHEPTVRAPRKAADAEPNEATTTKRASAAAIEPTEIVVPLSVMPTERPVIRRPTTSRFAPPSGRSNTLLWIGAAVAVVVLVAMAVAMWPSGVPSADKNAEANTPPPDPPTPPTPAHDKAPTQPVAHEEAPPPPAHDEAPPPPAHDEAAHEEAPAQESGGGMNATMADYSGTAAKPDDTAKTDTAKTDTAKTDKTDKTDTPKTDKTDTAKTAKAIAKKPTPKPAVKRPVAKPAAVKKPATKKAGTKWNPNDLFLGD